MQARSGRHSIFPEWEWRTQELYLVSIEEFVTRFAESKFPQRELRFISTSNCGWSLP
jgi:hypothetical protein